jgi:hypothetical protein
MKRSLAHRCYHTSLTPDRAALDVMRISPVVMYSADHFFTLPVKKNFPGAVSAGNIAMVLTFFQIRARTWSTVKFTIFDSEKGP